MEVAGPLGTALGLEQRQLERPAGFPSSDKTRPDSPVPTLQGPCGRSPTSSGTGVSGNFWGRFKGAKYRFVPDAGRDCGQEEKGTTEDEMAGWHHRLDGHEFG